MDVLPGRGVRRSKGLMTPGQRWQSRGWERGQWSSSSGDLRLSGAPKHVSGHLASCEAGAELVPTRNRAQVASAPTEGEEFQGPALTSEAALHCH